MTEYVRPFEDIDLGDVALVGGKNASLGEMYGRLRPAGIPVPGGFATTEGAWREFLHAGNIHGALSDVLAGLDTVTFSNLSGVGARAREIVLGAPLPAALQKAILDAHTELVKKEGPGSVAVRSSATAEDLPQASFAGLHESFLNISSPADLLAACHRCFASLFTDRAIKYRQDNGFDHMKVALSVGVQQMVRSDVGCAGVAFTLEPETGFRNVVVISGSLGLGENVVQGNVNPDEFVVFKPLLGKAANPIVSRRLGTKERKMIYAGGANHSPHVTTANVDTAPAEREKYILPDGEVLQLAGWAVEIERHYGRPMDIEWAKDGITGRMFIVQARPETVHAADREAHLLRRYTLKRKGAILARGTALGSRIASGRARILRSPSEADKLQPGEVLVTDMTNPDWDPVMHKAAAIVTNKGGRTSHAAIVAREIGVVAVVGTGNATEAIKDGQTVTVSCAEGKEGVVYDGEVPWEEKTTDVRSVTLPKTGVMLILGDPGRAWSTSFLPNAGVGLLRLEFAISNAVRVHPMALARFSEVTEAAAREEIERITKHYATKEAYFTEKLSEAVGTVAAAFHPKDVIVRMSDFKTNEYANLIGGRAFEPEEENPMLGFRGASRYYSDSYRDGFRLECEAMKRVRGEMGLTNVKLMVPFCRTIAEAATVVDLMASYGLRRGDKGLEIYMMAEIPSNIVLARKFARHFDGFSIGSNDLTQLTLGLDRDSALVSGLFDERDEAVRVMIATVIAEAQKAGVKIGLCGQAPSDLPEFAQFLVNCGIDNISFTPDALLQGIGNIALAEKMKKEKTGKIGKQRRMNFSTLLDAHRGTA